MITQIMESSCNSNSLNLIKDI